MKYLLSTGKETEKIEKYILDLFHLYLNIMPGDIPGSTIGFDYLLTNIKKDEVVKEIAYRLKDLVSKIQKQFSNVNIVLEAIELVNNEKVKIEISVNNLQDTLLLNLYEK